MGSVALVFAPHPDDAEIGMGATISALLSQGVRVVVVDLTDGEPTPYGSPEIRSKETQDASTILGITERRLLGITNRAVFDTVENRKSIATVIREYKPDILFAPYWEDAHPDHVQACALIEAARFYSKFVKTDMSFEPHYPRRVLHYFSTHLRPRFLPSFIFDVSGHLDRKVEAITAYRSQFVHHPGNTSRIDAIRQEALFWGDQISVEAGEPFVCRESLRITEAKALFSV
jgi:bacillithiol biosynthesis deacetylase BshB1